MSEIKNKILALRLVKWRDLDWLQNENLKEIPDENFLKLKNSLRKNNFIQPFNVWKDKSGKIWILDGHHRQKAMTELEADGVKIPGKLPANFIDCANKKEASKMVLVYSSLYAKISETGLKEYLELNKLLMSDIENETDLGFDLSLLNPEDKNKYDDNLEMVDKKKNLSDVYITVGEYRILVNRDVYLKWLEDLKTKAGFDKLSIAKEIKKRLKIK